jgi:hypothetical protein
MTINEKSLLDFIAKTGFPLELAVREIFAAPGRHWTVSSNVYYIDRDERKGRELDIIATYSELLPSEPRRVGQLRLVLILECKKSDSPWIVFTSSGFEGYQVWVDGLNMEAVRGEASRMAFVFGAAAPWTRPERVGRAWCVMRGSGRPEEPSKEDRSPIQAAFLTTLKAVESESKRAESTKDVTIFIPAVVLRGTLVESFLEDGALKVQETKGATCRVTYESESYAQRSMLVPIVTEEILPGFIDGCQQIAMRLAEILRDRPSWLPQEGPPALSRPISQRPSKKKAN